jgi:hypothetical protein
MKKLILFIGILLSVSCQKEPTLSDRLIGEWQLCLSLPTMEENCNWGVLFNAPYESYYYFTFERGGTGFTELERLFSDSLDYHLWKFDWQIQSDTFLSVVFKDDNFIGDQHTPFILQNDRMEWGIFKGGAVFNKL